jgi:DNA-binding LacI/PurR family transcriptional regulator
MIGGEAMESAPLYQIIIDDLEREIEAGEYLLDQPFCTEKRICERYRVSRITAKHAIDFLEQKGLLYRRRGAGSFVAPKKTFPAVSRNTSGTSALILPFDVSKGGMWRTLQTATSLLISQNIFLSLHVTNYGLAYEEAALRSVLDTKTDALVYYPNSEIPTELLDRFIAAGKRVIILDKPHDNKNYSNIVCDNYLGGFLLAEHLTAFGHTKTCYLSRFLAKDVGSIRDRFQGYVHALELADPTLMPRFLKLTLQPSEPLNFPMFRHNVNMLYNEGVTAMICENDEVAFYAMMCCNNLNIRVPEEMSITGFDNISWAVTGDAQITSVDQNFELIGKTIADLLSSDDPTPQYVKIPVQLIPRASTGPIPHTRRSV